MIGWEYLEFHPLAELFPLLSVPEQSDFADRIERDGYDPSHPIVIFEGKILDGRNRWSACDALRMEGRLAAPPPCVEFSGESPFAFVLQENLHRRHLNESQRAMVAERLATMKQGARTDLAPIGARSQQEAATLLNVSRRSVQRAAALREKAPALAESVEIGLVTLHEASRAIKKGERPPTADTRRFPEGKFSVIYADPPWRYDFMRVDAWAVENTYPTLDLASLLAMRPSIDALATPETVLFLWTTSAKLDWGVRVLEGWGFDFKSTLVWVKHRNAAGMGYWARIGHEILLIGARLKASPPPPERRFPSVVEADKGSHSEKPAEVRRIIEQMFPAATRVELFGRGLAPAGWTFWGNEAKGEP